MNLTKLFNFRYLKENIKKSKVILSIFTGLMPILNIIILLMLINSNNQRILFFDELSIVNFIGIYILPIIVSICLFNYIYKKNSVDFINSMPISRKSIFFTNLLGGIILFLLMLVIDVILILIVSQIFSLQIPFSIVFDYLWYWFIVYIFAFCTSNLAMSISGNAITQIAVTMLLFFLVPFLCIYTDELKSNNNYYDVLLNCNNTECLPEKYYCYNDSECNINKNANLYNINAYKVKDLGKYNALFGMPYLILENADKSIINQSNIISMIILSIVYTVLGYILFIKRKMEVCETTFKNKHIHNIVKSLTLVPFIALFYSVCEDADTITIIFALVIMLIYYFVYDLITRKNINNIKLSLAYFASTICIFVVIFSLVQKNNNKQNIINYEDIQEVSLPVYIYEDNTNKYINDKNLISILIKNSADDGYGEYDYYEESYIKLKNGDTYRINSYLNQTDYDKVINIISSNVDYINEYKNIDLNSVYAIQIGDKIYNKKDNEIIIDLISDSINELSLKEFIDLQNKYKYLDNSNNIKLYSYKNHESKIYTVSGYINYDILNNVVESNNLYLKSNIKEILPDNYEIYYSNSYFKDNYEIDYFVLRSSKKEMYNFILKEINNQVDMHDEYVTINLYFEGIDYYFTTNNIEEFKSILNSKYEEIKDTKEYIEYYEYEIVNEENTYEY